MYVLAVTKWKKCT